MKRLLLLGLLLASGGCASIDFKRSIPWAKEETPQDSNPRRLVAIWTDTVLHSTGKPATRGFGGRLYFYDDKNKAVPVEGTLIVYAYDDARGGSVEREPDRKFVFRPEEFVNHADSTKLGQSYSVWIPWDAVGGARSQITLLPMFTTNKGNVIAGQQAKLTLLGADPLPAPGSMPYNSWGQHAYGRDRDVQQASYQTPAPANFQPGAAGYPPETDQDRLRQMRTLSIPITDSLRQRLLEGGTNGEPHGRSPAPQDYNAGADLRAPQPLGIPVARENSGASLRATSFPSAMGHGVEPASFNSHTYHTAGEVWQGETARIAAALEEAQAGQQAASRGANRDPRFLEPASSRFERRRSPVPGGGAATPFPGPAHWQRSPEPLPSGLPTSPGGYPPNSVPATASIAGPSPR
jgi:hypothetical protein